MTDTLLKGTAHFASLGWQYPVSAGAQFVLFIAAMASRNEKLHAVVAVALLVDRTAIAVQSFQTVQ